MADFHKETIGDAVLFRADCREVLPTLGKVQAVVTDPPYLLSSGGNTESHKALGGWIGANINDGKPVFCDVTWREVMELAFSAMSDNADAYVMANDKNVHEAWSAALSVGFGFHNLLVWDKRNAVMNRWYMKNCEFTLYLWKGNARTIRDPSSKQLCTVPNLCGTDHPTVKPVELMAHYIENSTDLGECVLDPFMGSGTTGVAALKLGRRFVGVEIEPRYFDLACRRIEEAWKQPRLFEEPRPQPKQEALEFE